MNRPLEQPHRFFIGTRLLPCPYLSGRVERKVVTDLAIPDAARLYAKLSRAGFRRSHGLAYRPACPGCNACVPVRVVVDGFRTGRSFRRVLRMNSDLSVRTTPAHATGTVDVVVTNPATPAVKCRPCRSATTRPWWRTARSTHASSNSEIPPATSSPSCWRTGRETRCRRYTASSRPAWKAAASALTWCFGWWPRRATCHCPTSISAIG